MAAGERWQQAGLVFTTQYGTPIMESNINKQLKRLVASVEEPKLPAIRVHDLRHTFATLMLHDLLVPVKEVSELLGHADVATTLRTYAHVIPDQRDRGIEALGRLLAVSE